MEFSGHNKIAGSSQGLETEKLRQMAGSGLGDIGAIARLFDTEPEDFEKPLPRRIHTAEDVTRGLGLTADVAERVHTLLEQTRTDFNRKAGGQRLMGAKGQLFGYLRQQKDLDFHVRRELARRADAFWRRRGADDMHMVIKSNRHGYPGPQLVISRELLFKAVGHKYTHREPDGKGGYRYYYAEDKRPTGRKGTPYVSHERLPDGSTHIKEHSSKKDAEAYGKERRAKGGSAFIFSKKDAEQHLPENARIRDASGRDSTPHPNPPGSKPPLQQLEERMTEARQGREKAGTQSAHEERKAAMRKRIADRNEMAGGYGFTDSMRKLLNVPGSKLEEKQFTSVRYGLEQTPAGRAALKEIDSARDKILTEHHHTDKGWEQAWKKEAEMIRDLHDRVRGVAKTHGAELAEANKRKVENEAADKRRASLEQEHPHLKREREAHEQATAKGTDASLGLHKVREALVDQVKNADHSSKESLHRYMGIYQQLTDHEHKHGETKDSKKLRAQIDEHEAKHASAFAKNQREKAAREPGTPPPLPKRESAKPPPLPAKAAEPAKPYKHPANEPHNADTFARTEAGKKIAAEADEIRGHLERGGIAKEEAAQIANDARDYNFKQAIDKHNRNVQPKSPEKHTAELITRAAAAGVTHQWGKGGHVIAKQEIDHRGRPQPHATFEVIARHGEAPGALKAHAEAVKAHLESQGHKVDMGEEGNAWGPVSVIGKSHKLSVIPAGHKSDRRGGVVPDPEGKLSEGTPFKPPASSAAPEPEAPKPKATISRARLNAGRPQYAGETPKPKAFMGDVPSTWGAATEPPAKPKKPKGGKGGGQTSFAFSRQPDGSLRKARVYTVAELRHMHEWAMR